MPARECMFCGEDPITCFNRGRFKRCCDDCNHLWEME